MDRTEQSESEKNTMSLFDSGSKGLKFETIGETHIGVVSGEAFERQAMKFGTTEPDVWPSGEPKMQVLVPLRVDGVVPDDPDDDGERTLYVSSNAMKQAIGKAIRDAGVKDIAIGGTLTVSFIGYDPNSKNKQNPKKLYQASYQPPASPLAGVAAPVANAYQQPVAAVMAAVPNAYQQPVAQPIPQAPAPVAQPVAALQVPPTPAPVATPPAPTTQDDVVGRVKALIAVGLTDQQIAADASIGFSDTIIAAIRANLSGAAA